MLAFIGLAALLAGLALRAVADGEVLSVLWFDPSEVQREQQPQIFWLSVTVWLGGALSCTCWCLWLGWLRFEAWLTCIEQRLIDADPHPPVDIAIHLERICRRKLATAGTHIFIPNQEWFPPEHRRLLNLIDLIACKSWHGLAVLKQLLPFHRAIVYTGFSTLVPPVVWRGPPFDCLHIAGQSPLKGTEAVVAVWQRHPEWPMLHLVTDLAVTAEAANIRCHRDLDAAAIAELRAHCLIAVQPSEVEGFGHVLAEAMTAAGVVVTTDGPPMNELIQPGRGFLVRYDRQRPLRVGTCYQIDEAELERVLARVFATPVAELMAVGEQAQRWQQAAHQQFAEQLVALVRQAAGNARREREANSNGRARGG